MWGWTLHREAAVISNAFKIVNPGCQKRMEKIKHIVLDTIFINISVTIKCFLL